MAKTTRTPRTMRIASAVVLGKIPPDSNDSQRTRPAAAAPTVAATPLSRVLSPAPGTPAGSPMSTDSDSVPSSFPLWAMGKRLVDLIGAGLGLLVLSPLFAVCAVAVRLDSRGPVFFRQ